MSRSPEHGGEPGYDIDEVRPRRSRRRLTVGRVLLNLVVIAAFAGAVFVLYTLVQDSGILARELEVAPLAFEDVPADNPLRDSIEEAVRTLSLIHI